jgi:serine-type D-Ala-D-Ala carboxypeptidase/endopeptidase (penicillin-binding protein 4)
MYENMVMCTFEQNTGLSFTPSSYNFKLIVDKDYTINRDLDSNYFNVSTAILGLSDFEQQVPICRMTDQVVPLLERVVWHKINIAVNHPDDSLAKTIYSVPKDPVINRMMTESDNFIAEHLLLTCGSVLDDTLSTYFIIDSLLTGPMSHLYPKPKWVDGSGLSRYNLMTADMYVQLLKDMYKQYGEARMFALLGSGGQEGTLKHYYNDKASPYVYAKTGTLSSVFCLSGYIVTNSGKRLAFSIMNNHFNTSASKARRDVQRILKQVHQSY